MTCYFRVLMPEALEGSGQAAVPPPLAPSSAYYSLCLDVYTHVDTRGTNSITWQDFSEHLMASEVQGELGEAKAMGARWHPVEVGREGYEPTTGIKAAKYLSGGVSRIAVVQGEDEGMELVVRWLNGQSSGALDGW